MRTTERLQAYGVFDDDVIARVQTVADQQNRYSFDELATQFDLSGPTRSLPPAKGARHPIEFLQFTPDGDYDETATRVLLTPMAMPVDKGIAMRAMRLFAAQPDRQLKVFGSPSLLGNPSNVIGMHNLQKVWYGNLRPTVSPPLHYLHDNNITTLDIMGYSYGADRGAAMAASAKNYEMNVEHAVVAEPASVVKRNPVTMLRAFARAGGPLEDNVRAANSPPLVEARSSDQHPVRYYGSFLRASNLAIAGALMNDGFMGRAAEALAKQPDMQMTVAWGTASELTDNDAVTEITRLLGMKYGSRIGSLVLDGMVHAGGDDIDLHAAIMLQGLRQPPYLDSAK